MTVPHPRPVAERAPDPSVRIAGSVLPLSAAQELVSSLDGVVSAMVEPTESGQVSAIHVLTDGSVPAKAMVRNVESALMARLGLRVDHRKISVAVSSGKQKAIGLDDVVAQAQSVVLGASGVMGGAGSRPAAPVRALYFDGVEVRGSRNRGVTVQIALKRGPETFHGVAEGLDGARARMELAARATLEAIGESERGARKFTLEGVKEVDAFETRFALVGLTVQWGREQVLLAGTCEIRESVETASALAVLDATNRWLSWRDQGRP